MNSVGEAAQSLANEAPTRMRSDGKSDLCNLAPTAVASLVSAISDSLCDAVRRPRDRALALLFDRRDAAVRDRQLAIIGDADAIRVIPSTQA